MNSNKHSNNPYVLYNRIKYNLARNIRSLMGEDETHTAYNGARRYMDNASVSADYLGLLVK